MPEWVTSGRIGSPEKLKEWEAALRAADNVVQAANLSTRALQYVAEAEAAIQTFTQLLSSRKTLAFSADVLLSDLIGGFLDDAAFLLTHTNLRRVMDRFGVAPFLKGAEADRLVSTDPVRTQFPTPYTGQWWRMNSARLGSSTVNALDRTEWESGFDLWQEDILAAFDDAGDFQRPAYGADQELAALVITTQSANMLEYFDKFSTLVKLFTKRPAELVLPQIAEYIDGESILDLGMMATSQRLRPALTAEDWNTPPDFVRLATKDLLPLVGDYLLSMLSLKAQFDPNSALKVSLEGIGTFAHAYIERMERIISQAREILSYLVALLSQPGFSRLWIPLDVGGHARIQQEIAAAESSRKDLQRIVNPSNSGRARNEIIGYSDAVAIKAGDVAFQFTPVEDLLVGGAVVVLHPGFLYDLFESMFAPRAEDVTESEGGARVVPDYDIRLPELGEPPRSPFPTTESPLYAGDRPGPRGRPVDPPGQARTGWTETALGSERPVGPSTPLVGGVLARTRTPHSAVYPAGSGAALQLVGAGSQRSSLLRFDTDPYSDRPVSVVGAESRGAELVVVGGDLSEAEPAPGIHGDIFALPGERLPVGDSPSSPGGALSSMLQAIPASLARDAAQHLVPSPVEILDAGSRAQIPDLDAIVSGYGFAGGVAVLESLTPGRHPWWVDVAVFFVSSSGTRRAYVRAQVLTVSDATAPFTYTLSPSLPAYPVITTDSTSGVAIVGPRIGMTRRLAARAAAGTRQDFVEVDAPGAVFETLGAVRRRRTEGTDDPAPGIFSTLQVEAMGNIVDADTGNTGRQKGALLGRSSAGDIEYWATDTLPEGSRLFSKAPLPPMMAGEDLPTGARPTLSPLYASRAAYGRTESALEFPYYINDHDPGTPQAGFDHRYSLSGRVGVADQDFHILTARADRWVRVGLGLVDASIRTVPAAAQASGYRVLAAEVTPPGLHVGPLVSDAATMEIVPDAVNPASLALGFVEPTTAFATDYAGYMWVIEFLWDTQVAEVQATLLPYMQATDEPIASAWNVDDPALADEFLTSGDAITARFGACLAGEAAMSGSGRFGDECVWVDARALVDVARLPKEDQARKVSLVFAFMAPPSGTGCVWTLAETPSHVAVLNCVDEPRIEIYERDLLDGVLVQRNSFRIPEPTAGVQYQLDFWVDVVSQELHAEWLRGEPAGAEEPVFSTIVSDSFAPSPGARERARALDGYPMPGATIRIGRPRPPMQLDVRTGPPYQADVDVEISGSLENVPWAWGSFPIALLVLDVTKP